MTAVRLMPVRFVNGPDQGPGVGQEDPGVQLQGHPAGGGLGQLRPEDVVDPVEAVARVHFQPGPEGLGLAVPQAGQVAQALTPEKAQQRGQAGPVGMGVGHEGQPVHNRTPCLRN